MKLSDCFINKDDEKSMLELVRHLPNKWTLLLAYFSFYCVILNCRSYSYDAFGCLVEKKNILRKKSKYLKDDSLFCKVYNMNAGKNKKLLERCRWLADYMVFVDKVREYHKGRTEAKLEEDISKAIDYCIENNYLKGFFTSRRSEVLEVTKVDYTFERRMKLNYEEGREDGEKSGILKGRLEGKVELIRELIKNEKWSAEKAMKSVGIPESEYDTYLKML